MRHTRSIRFSALLVASAALALSACKSEPEGAAAGTAGEQAEVIAKVAAPAGKAWADVVTKTPEGGYVMGNPDAPIKLVEWGSLTCHVCKEFSEKAFVSIRDNYVASGRVSFEFRNFLRDPVDLTATMLTRCGPPETYFALTEQVYGQQDALLARLQADGAKLQPLLELPENERYIQLANATGLTEFFAARGIARDQANACLAKGADASALANQSGDQGKQYNITGTPTFMINGEVLTFNSWPEIEARMQQMGAR